MALTEGTAYRITYEAKGGREVEWATFEGRYTSGDLRLRDENGLEFALSARDVVQALDSRGFAVQV